MVVIACKLGNTRRILVTLRTSYYPFLSSLDIYRLEKSENAIENPALQKISSRLRDMTIHIRFQVFTELMVQWLT